MWKRLQKIAPIRCAHRLSWLRKMKHRKQWLHAYIGAWVEKVENDGDWHYADGLTDDCLNACTVSGRARKGVKSPSRWFSVYQQRPPAWRTCLSGVPLQAAARLNACCREEAREKLKTLRRSSSALRFLQKTDDVLGSEKEHFTNGLKAVPSPIWSYHAGRQCPKIRDLRFCFGLPRRSEKTKTSHNDHIRAGRLNASSDFLRVHRAPDGQGEKRSDLENIQHFFKKCH